MEGSRVGSDFDKKADYTNREGDFKKYSLPIGQTKDIPKMVRPKKFETQEKRNLPKRFVLIGILLITLVVVEIWVTNAMVTFGQKLASIENSQRSIQLENRILENEIAKQTALGNIASASATLGFIKPKTIQYVR